ncbi:tumor necrosis factor ligand superfamily member 18 [Erinaceus europaeus]|uniref:Tumor necrosis factor ligand superfamily member 18 n=1 Tax=Erinaceus europaeus TaxID=9365 RepID=A0A1S2ZVK3_ERIEU|nr:tumor necrosis factor ligand superfamily member 18 [Erinaceus europaeus]
MGQISLSQSPPCTALTVVAQRQNGELPTSSSPSTEPMMNIQRGFASWLTAKELHFKNLNMTVCKKKLLQLKFGEETAEEAIQRRISENLNLMERMPLNLANPQEMQRPAWKQWFLHFLVIVLLLSSTISACIFLLFKTANKPCIAKFGPLPSKWQMTSPESPCVNKVADWELKILQNGLYLIYGQVAPNTTYKELAPFEVRLRKNQNIIQTVTDKSKIQYLGRPCELRAEDTIDLIFNSEHQIFKNNTYLGIYLIENLKFIS